MSSTVLHCFDGLFSFAHYRLPHCSHPDVDYPAFSNIACWQDAICNDIDSYKWPARVYVCKSPKKLGLNIHYLCSNDRNKKGSNNVFYQNK